MKNRLANPIIPSPEFDLTKIIEFAAVVIGIVTSFIVWVNKYFEDKKRHEQGFIAEVVKATIDSSLSDYKTDFHSFKTKMESQVEHFNKTVIDIYAEIAKR